MEKLLGDLNRLMPLLVDGRETHVEWRDWLRLADMEEIDDEA